MPFVTINETKLFYETVGQGEPCIVLHGGFGFDHTSLKPWLDPLVKHFRLIYLDQRGHGRSERTEPDQVTLHQLAEDLEALRLQWDMPSLFGQSVGAAVALEYALHWPTNLSRLMLITPAWKRLFGPSSLEHAERKGATPEMLALLALNGPLTDDQFREGFRMIAPLYFHRFDAELFDKLCSGIRYDAALLGRTVPALAEAQLARRLHRLSCPGLILAGDDDFACPVSDVQELAKKTGFPLTWIPQTGHFPYAENPSAFFQRIEEWLHRLPFSKLVE